MSHNNYIYKRNHWQLHSKKVIQKERYPWLSYQSLCRKKNQGSFFFGLLGVDWWSGRIPQETPRHVLPRWPDRFCMGWLGQLHRVAFACLCAWDVSLGASGVRVFLCFFFWEKQLRSRTCDSNVSSGSLRVWCVLQLQSTIMCVCEVLPWIFFGVARKLGASHPIQTAATKNLTHSLFMTSHPNFPHMSPFTQKETNILKV